jgi:hypothetical protein
MATQKLNVLQVSSPKDWAGLTTDNHLYSVFMNEPQMASSIVTHIFAQNMYMGLDMFLSKYPAKELPHDGEYEWLLKGDDRKAVTILSYTSADMTRPGIGPTEFDLELAENFYQATDVLMFDDREFTVRIMSDGIPTGTGWTYKVKHLEPSTTHFIPPTLLAAGKRVSKERSVVSNTLSKDGGGVQFTSPFKMRNWFSTLRKKYVVPGNMQDRPLVITITAPDGKKTNVWTRYQEMMVDWQWNIERANDLVFSKYNRNTNGTTFMKDTSGFPIYTGAGLRQQISPSYKFYYTTFTMDLLQEILFSLSENILPEDQREFVLLTGERGMNQFHKAVEDKVALLFPLGVDRHTGSGQNLGFGGQYRTYNFPQGINVTVMNLQQYNDPVDNRLPHPDGGFTENYRYTIMNIGTTNGEPNIQRVYPAGRKELKWYVPGSTSPFGPSTTNGLGSSAVDGYEVHRQGTQGIMLKNPTTCAELIFSA